MSYYLMHRGWQGNEVFGRDEFSRRDAWVWLIENAAFAPSKGVERGQIRISLRELGRFWRWQDPRVRRCLASFRERLMIDCVADASGTLITICNYENYQAEPKTPTHQPTRERRTNGSVGDAQYKEGMKEEGILDSPNGESYRSAFDLWWEGYPEKVGKGAAKKSFTKALAKTSLDQLQAGLERYKATKPLDRPWCNPATWLNQERWLDVPASNGHASDSNVLPFGGPPTGPPPIPEGGFFPVDGTDSE